MLFPQAGGGTAPASVTGWSPSRIDVLTPEPVGDGPVGFVTESDADQGIDPDAALQFADVLAGCLGASLLPAAGRLSGVFPHGLGSARHDVGRLPGDVNVFHGGPIVLGVSPASGVEGGARITVRGRNWRPAMRWRSRGCSPPRRSSIRRR